MPNSDHKPLTARLLAVANRGQQSLLNALSKELSGCESVLDVGCGRSSVLEQLARLPRMVGVDAHAPAVEESRRRGVHDEYTCADVATLELAPRSFDAVLMMDLIEHLERPAGEQLLERMGEVARRKVIVFTPNGFIEQDEYGDNPLQVHRSGWTAEDFIERGFRVSGEKGWSALRDGSAARRPALLTRPLLSLSQPLVQRVPRFAFALLAVRDVHAPE